MSPLRPCWCRSNLRVIENPPKKHYFTLTHPPPPLSLTHRPRDSSEFFRLSGGTSGGSGVESFGRIWAAKAAKENKQYDHHLFGSGHETFVPQSKNNNDSNTGVAEQHQAIHTHTLTLTLTRTEYNIKPAFITKKEKQKGEHVRRSRMVPPPPPPFAAVSSTF